MPLWEDFKCVKTPNEGSHEWLQIINNSKHYYVEIENKELVISRYREKQLKQYEYSGLKIVGTDYGEWGGDLKVIYPDCTEILLKKGNIKSIFEYNGDLFFLEGLEHMYENIGYLYQLVYDGDYISYKECIDLKECPNAFYIYNSHLYIISSENLFEISSEDDLFKKNIIFEGLPFSAFVPNSLVVYKEYFVIGMRGGLGKIDYVNTNNLKYMQLKK
ncbi:hypothetical protein [Lysinibacillus sp. NPDC056232]|uniref:hypothetical protein n=1 Tax=Lysinibacillus sp. NPDC056232 TaxID=3345756 RepID=UPI0035E004A2